MCIRDSISTHFFLVLITRLGFAQAHLNQCMLLPWWYCVSTLIYNWNSVITSVSLCVQAFNDAQASTCILAKRVSLLVYGWHTWSLHALIMYIVYPTPYGGILWLCVHYMLIHTIPLFFFYASHSAQESSISFKQVALDVASYFKTDCFVSILWCSVVSTCTYCSHVCR